ncbi:TPA: hypothetical protein ACH3X2_013314 [Trebouxia sp. C0005]
MAQHLGWAAAGLSWAGLMLHAIKICINLLTWGSSNNWFELDSDGVVSIALLSQWGCQLGWVTVACPLDIRV